MGKIIHILIAIMACMPAILLADDDDSKYLAGAVPEEDGKVVFAKEIDLPGSDQNSVFDQALNWLDARAKENNNGSRIVFSDKGKGQIVAYVEEYLVFTNNALSLDRSLLNYNLVVLCKPGKCEMQIERIRFNYENKKLTAEEMIADKIALNKAKTEIYRGYKKFRINAVDYVGNFFKSVNSAFGVKEGSAKQEIVAVQSLQTPQSQVVVQASEAPVATQATVMPVAVQSTPQAETRSPLLGYKQLTPDKIPGNIIKMLNEDWMIITAGTDEKFNMMTAGWGGIGMLYSKPVAICFINPLNYTYQFMEKNDTYTFTFYTEAYRDALLYCGSNSGRNIDKVKGSGLTPITTPSGSKAFSEAWLIIECRKLVGQSLNNETLFDDKVKAEWEGKQLPKMFIGEIINVWVK